MWQIPRFLGSLPLKAGLICTCLGALSQAQHAPSQRQGLEIRASDSGSSSNGSSSFFISPSTDVAFALNVPSDSKTDLYFSLMVSKGVTWGAVGLGTNQMAGALVLLAYGSSSGNNVTISPRLANGENEPVYSADIHVEALDGTGLMDDSYYVFNGRCTNCRSWNDGSNKIDTNSENQDFLFASGPPGLIKTDSPDAPLMMHYNYGTFTMNLKQATGDGAVPKVDVNGGHITTVANGAQLTSSTTGYRDPAAIGHGVMMVFCFFGLMPFSIFIIRFGGWVRWHAVNNTIALAGIIMATVGGVHLSSMYNRTKGMRHPHQVIGFIVVFCVIAQFVLGIVHHRIYKRTQAPTKLSPIHIWLGRVVICLAVINAFIGFPLAQLPRGDFALLAIVIVVGGALALVLGGKNFIRRRLLKRGNLDDGNAGSVNHSPAQGARSGYTMEPWNNGSNGGAGLEVGGLARSEGYQNSQASGGKSEGGGINARDIV